MPRLIGVAAAQISPVLDDPERSVDKMERVAESIADTVPWVDLICFPELCSIGLHEYVGASVNHSPRQFAEPIPGAQTGRFCSLAKRIHKWLIPGSMYESDGDCVYNTAVAISPGGEIVARYRKLYPWRPVETTTPGNTGFCVFDIPGVGHFGICICYDMWFPEVARTLAWMGAEVILHPSLTSTCDRDAETVLVQANAIFNQCYFVDVNATGIYGGGRSQIVDPDGNVLRRGTEHEGILTQILDLDQGARTRELGTVGLSQAWKSWRDTPLRFPPYDRPVSESPMLSQLGKLQYPENLRNV